MQPVPPRIRAQLTVAAGLIAPPGVCAVLIPLRGSLANTDAALLLVAVIVAVAALGSRAGGLLASLSSGLWFDFFLTRPYYRLSIASRTNIETTVLLLVVGVAVTEIAAWGYWQQRSAAPRAKPGISPGCMPPPRQPEPDSRRIES